MSTEIGHRTNTVKVALFNSEAAALDKMRGNLSRAAAIRRLILSSSGPNAIDPDRMPELLAELQAANARFAELEREAAGLRKKLKTAEDYGDAITIERDKALSNLANMQDERDELRARLHAAIEGAKALEAKVDAYELCLASAQLIPRRDP